MITISVKQPPNIEPSPELFSVIFAIPQMSRYPTTTIAKNAKMYKINILRNITVLLLLNQHVNLIAFNLDNAAFHLKQLLAVVGVVLNNPYLTFAQCRYYWGVVVQHLKRAHNARHAHQRRVKFGFLNTDNTD